MLANRIIGAQSGDPYWSNVVALLHMDGTDGSTTFIDERGHTFTANGNAQIDTAQSKFGGASGLFDGSGDYISTPDSADWDFGTGDFTVEFWVRFNALPVNSVVTMVSTYLSNTGWEVQYRTDVGEGNRLTFGVGDARNNFSWSPSTNTWYHIAVARAGTNLRAFIDGAQIGSTLTNSDNLTNTAQLWIGALNSGGAIQGFNGWLDELRITKGVARYTANFTPPAAPFPAG